MKRILYLHGLESQQGGRKVDALTRRACTFAPALNYKEDNNTLLHLAAQTEPVTWDICIGSSIGGYAAYHLAKCITVKQLILLNPVLHRKDIPLLLPTPKSNTPTPKIDIYWGRADEVIPVEKTKAWLTQQHIRYTGHEADYGHRTPLEYFEKLIAKYM